MPFLLSENKMSNIHTLINQRIGTLTVIGRTRNERGNRARFICRCDCGKERIIFADELLTGKFEPCDCMKPKKTKKQKQEE